LHIDGDQEYVTKAIGIRVEDDLAAQMQDRTLRGKITALYLTKYVTGWQIPRQLRGKTPYTELHLLWRKFKVRMLDGCTGNLQIIDARVMAFTQLVQGARITSVDAGRQ